MHLTTRGLSILTITLLTSLISAAEEPPSNQSNILVVEKKEPGWQLSIIAGGLSKHLTSEYEPINGYTEQHSNLGLEVGQVGPGWVASLQVTRFNDSHDENSFMGIGAYGYKAVLPYQFFIYGGIGAGYLETSYYSGAIIMPYGELGWWRVSVQGSYLPEFSDSDSGIAVQFKFRIFEW